MGQKGSHKMSADAEEAGTPLNQQTYRESESDVEKAMPGTSGSSINLDTPAAETTSSEIRDHIDRTSAILSLSRNESEAVTRMQLCSGVPIEERENQHHEVILEPATPVDNELNKLNLQLLDAIINQDNVELERLLNKGASPNATRRAKNFSGETVIHYCENFMESVIRSKPEWTALHIASFAGYSRSTRLLLDADANPNITDELGDTPLAIAGEAFSLNSNMVDIGSYLETIDILLEHRRTKSNPLETSSRELASALVTAVSLSCEEAVKLLLDAGAPVIQHNRHGNTPLHECVRTCNENILQLLAERLKPKPGQVLPSLDVTDYENRYTVLQIAVLASWLPGVRFALNAKADVTHEDKNGFTAIHLAARKGNLEILNLIIDDVENVDLVHNINDKVEKPLICAIRSGNLDCVKALIEKKATLQHDPLQRHTLSDDNVNQIYSFLKDHENGNKSAVNSWENITRKNKVNFNMILHASWIQTTEVEFVNILEYLFDCEKSLIDLLDYRCPDLKYMIPLEVAAFEKKLHIYKFLLKKSVDRAVNMKEKFDPIILWFIFRAMFASIRKYYKLKSSPKGKIFIEMMKITIDIFPDIVQILPMRGVYILHAAIVCNDREMMRLQIKNGADLSVEDHYGQTAISLLMKLGSSVEFLTSILDDRVTFPTNYEETSESFVYFDYSVLAPSLDYKQDEVQVRVLKALIETGNYKGQKELLMHPLIESFLYRKWQAYTKYFCSVILIYICIASLLSILIVSVFYFKDQEESTSKNEQPSFLFHLVLYCITIVLLCIIVIEELSLIHLDINVKRFIIKCLFNKITLPSCETLIECFVKCGSFILTIVTPLIITMQSEIIEWWRYLAAITLILVWGNLMLLLSNTPTAGYYMQMFWSVSLKIFKILTVFFSLIIMFTACFMVLSHNKAPFNDPYAAVIKTLVMMTSEFEYENHFSKVEPSDVFATLMILRFVFAVFLIVTAIVLMNLMTGVAVSDANDLIYKGNLRRLEKQIEIVYALEVSKKRKSMFHSVSLHKYFKSDDVIFLKPNICSFEKHFSEHIIESITKKAQEKIKIAEKKTKSDELKETFKNILQATSRNEENIKKTVSKLEEHIKTNEKIKDLLNEMFLAVTSKS